MKKLIALIMVAASLLFMGGCVVNPYTDTMKSLDAKGGILDQNMQYIQADTSLSRDQKERRITEVTAVKLVIQRSIN